MALIKRHEDWPVRLAAFLESRANTPFEWGKHDCVMFTACAVEAMTGEPYSKERKKLGLKYTSKKSAAKVVKDNFGKIEDIFTAYFGEARNDIAFSMRGDVAIVKNGGNYAGGIVDNTGRTIICAGKDGLVKVPKTEAIKYWPIGR